MVVNIYFSYGGHYSDTVDEVKWIAKGCLRAITFKRTPVDDITYSMLVEKIYEKIAIDESTTKLKLSHFPVISVSEARIQQAEIIDDSDVYAYLTSLDREGRRSALHVEVIQDLAIIPQDEQLSRVEKRSSHGVNYGELVSTGRGNGMGNGGALTLYGSGEPVDQPHEPSEPMENVDVDAERDNVSHENMDNNVETSVNEELDNIDMCAFLDRVELPLVSQECHYVDPWEDGLGLTVGQEFVSKQIVQDLVERAAHEYCFGFNIVNSDKKRYVVKCRGAKEGCKWYLRVAKLAYSTFFSVRVYNKMHTCSRASSSSSNKRKGTPRLVASILHEDYPGQFETPNAKSIVNLVQGRIGVEVSYSTALRGKKQAISDVRGSPEDSFMMLPSYLYMLEKVNPGTKTEFVLDEKKRFKYLFFALGASIEGFQAMRKVIIVDATFLKTIHNGVLIVATAQDPNRHVYPLAFGVADGEKDDSWTWFFETLKTCIPDSRQLVFVSDRHKSLIKAVGEVYPMSQHGFCIFHLSQNVRTKVTHDKDVVAGRLMEIAQIYSQVEFDRRYADFCSRYPSVAEYLGRSTELHKWARSYFPGERYCIDTSNCAESINSVFRNARAYSLLPMIDAIVAKISEWFNKYRQDSVAGSDAQKLVPFVENELHARCEPASKLMVTELNTFQLEYVVVGREGMSYVVNLRTKSCSCKCFDIDRYPCVHGIAACMKFLKKEHREAGINELHDLCSEYYTVYSWALAYYQTIYPVPHMSEWIIPDHIRKLIVFPPEHTTKPGRIQETRFPSAGERRKKNKLVKGRNLGRWFGTDSESGSQH